MYCDPSGNSLLAAILIAVACAAGIYGVLEKKYNVEKASNVGLEIAKNSKNSIIADVAGKYSTGLSCASALFTIYNTNKALTEKEALMNQMMEDTYNLAVDKNYSIPNNSFSAYTQDEYNAVCYKNVPIVNQEIEINRYTTKTDYPDIGKVCWDDLSTESQSYLNGRYKDLFPKEFLNVSGHYSAEGAIVP